MKRLVVFLAVAMALVFLVDSAVNADTIKRRNTYTDKQTFERGGVVSNDFLEFGDNASITSDSKIVNPENRLKNVLLGIWSGGSRYGIASGGKYAVPDGWNIQGTYTGVTRIDATDAAPGSGSTVYPGFPHSIYIENRNPSSTGIGTTAYFTYPAENGVSSSAAWYRNFAGKKVVFGAYVWIDATYASTSGVTTQFIRPFINTYGSAGYVTGESSFAIGAYPKKHGWNLLTAVTDVPDKATGLEVGFYMNPTVAAINASTGDSAYITAPFLLVDPLHKGFVPVPQETIFFANQVGFNENGTSFDLQGAGTSSFTVANSTTGKISPNADALYVTMQGQMPTTSGNFQVSLRKNSTDTSDVTFYPSGLSGTSLFTVQSWVPTDYNGDFDLYASTTVNGVSMFVTGAKMR